MYDAIVAGLEADPPRSFPYVALAAAYLDGKPANGEPPPPQQLADLSTLSREQLRERAERLVQRLTAAPDESTSTGLAVIDATIIRDELDNLSPRSFKNRYGSHRLKLTEPMRNSKG